MRLNTFLLLLPFLFSLPQSTLTANNHHAPIPRSLDAILVEPSPSPSSPTPTPTPHIKHLDLRQVAAGVGGAGAAAAPAQPAAVAAPAAPAAAPAAVDPTDSPTVQAGGAASATPVKSGAIGMGTLTGVIGVVNTKDADKKSGGAPAAGGIGGGIAEGKGLVVMMVCWGLGVVLGGGGWIGLGFGIGG